MPRLLFEAVKPASQVPEAAGWKAKGCNRREEEYWRICGIGGQEG